MLKIVRSRHASSGRGAFCRDLLELVNDGKPACLIVPEQQTVMAEGLMSRILPPSSALCFEVTNFTRLANTTFRSLGGLSGEYCDSAKKALIMWRALTELSPFLTMTSGRKEITSGLVESSLAATQQMQSLGIRPDDLVEAAEHDSIKQDGRLSAKLTDLAKLFSLYKKLLGERYADTGDDADAMIRKLEENQDFLADTQLFIEGFTSFTEPQYRLISILAARTSVSVALTLPKGMEEAFEYTEIVGTEQRLLSEARKHSVDVKRVREEGFLKNRNESLDEICSHLWTTYLPNDNITLQNREDLRIFQAHTPYDECDFICEDIKRRVVGGASYSDFAVIARSVDDYRGILDGALSRAGIPAFLSYRRDINEFEAIKLIYTAYAVARGFKREDVISYAKCSLSGISRDECDEFEMYVNKWQINGRRFTDETVWNMNPEGYSTKWKDSNDEKLLRIHSVRERIVGPLSAFADEISGAKTVKEQSRVLLNFLLKIDLEGSLKERAKKLKSLKENALAEENASLWKIICGSLDTIVSVLGDCSADGEAFISQLKTAFSAADIGRIPAFADQLTVGSADMLRLYEKKHVYLIGVNAGRFPSAVNDKSYFSESDKIKLSKCGLGVNPEMEIKGARELYIFSRAFSYATNSVTLTYCSADTKFKSIEPAEVIDRISKLTGAAVNTVKISSLSPFERIFSPESALYSIGEFSDCYGAVRDALAESGYEDKIAICEGDISSERLTLGEQIIAPNESMSMSQSKIDTYVNCPFGYFCKYVIKLCEEERAEFDARNIGSFIHAILENFFRTLSDQGRKSADLSREERINLTRRSAEEYISQLGDDVINASVKTKIKIDRLCRAALPVVEGLCEEFARSAFEPRFFELSLQWGNDETPDPIHLKADSGAVNIFGVVDRVDAYKKGKDVYLRVIDYKTGQKSFSPDDLAEGKNLQMFLYLKALVESENEKFRNRLGVEDGGRLIPAGVIYVKTGVRDLRVKRPDDEDALNAIKSAQEREGMILDDQEVISAMTLRYSPVYSEKYPDKITEANKKFLYTEDGWNEIMETVEDSVCRVADGIRAGVIDASPKTDGKRSSCDYCQFKPICRKA